MVNVVAVLQNFESSSTYYSYNNFEEHRIEEIVWNKYNSNVFPDRMQNLQGSLLPILFGGSEPGVIISNYPNGDNKIGGFVGHMFRSFAKKHNARLNTSCVNTSISENDLHKLVLNGHIEISGTGLRMVQDSAEWYSYPYLLFDFGVMLPIEPKIPLDKVFAFVFSWDTFLATILVFMLLSFLQGASARISKSHGTFFSWDFFLNIDCFRGILGRPFKETPNASCSKKIIYSMVFLLGIMIVTLYDAFLQSFMTDLPRENLIRTFNDLQLSGLKIYSLQSYIDDLLYKFKPQFEMLSNLFIIENNFETFTKFRNISNTKYAFTVSDIKWKVYENQQNFFGQQLFRWSKELCLLKVDCWIAG
ncbi:uncharacterized protein LOC129918115 [Episyrphus balteatus]|uniref:uncharacterized protein LOC129918115 n=1 Tax=Episyrphus balteatus TaxID=286459 RepID=UPI002485A715|nr:uncharacterized protein LOC129918115 [Episyrphus balteatus]